MAPSPFYYIVKHWKKTVPMIAVSSTALWYTYDYTLTNDLMKVSCSKASKYGDERLANPKAPVRHITVILNPVAGKRKSKKLYNKWVEPLLHLAGIKVSVIETQSPNQAYDLMKIMSNCDGVAIVGGDGTVHDALNGLLHRPDSVKASREFPLAIIPTGQYNSIARYIHQGNMLYRNQKEFLINATMKLVESSRTKFDVIKIRALNEDSPVSNEAITEESVDSIYALRDLRYGFYQDNFFKVSGYHFYQTYLKPVWLRIHHMLRPGKYVLPQIESVSFTMPCIGCSSCHRRHLLNGGQRDDKQEESGASKRWWSVLGSATRPTSSGPSEEEKKELELSKRENPDCGTWINAGVVDNVTDFRACMMGDKKVRLTLGRDREYNPLDVTETQDVRLIVKPQLDEEMRVSRQEKWKKNDTAEKERDDNNTNEAEEAKKDVSHFLIDGQPIQAHSVEVTAINKAITIFTGPYKIT